MMIQRRWYTYSLYCSSALILMLLFFCHPLRASAGQKIAARVGGTVITEAELENAAKQYYPEGIFHGDPSALRKEEYRKSALNSLIETKLLSLEAKNRGMKASEETVDAVMNDNIKKFGSKEKMKKALEPRGLTPENLREQITDNTLANALLGQLLSEAGYSEDELSRYYEDNRARFRQPEALHLYHIHISVEPTASEEVWQEKKKRADEILAKIRDGGDFGRLAYEFSDDTYRYKSGDMGYVHRGRLSPPELEEEAFKLKKDEMSEVIRTIYGFHILKAGETKPAETKSFLSVRAVMKKDLEKKRFEAAKDSLIERLKKEYPVEINAELLKLPDEK